MRLQLFQLPGYFCVGLQLVPDVERQK
jgi:hypothetical protein